MPSPRRGITPGQVKGLPDLLTELQAIRRQLVQRISFGDPLGTDADGKLVNVEGAWVEATVTNLAAAFTCTHGLGAPYSGGATRPNVRWLLFGVEHDGTGAGAADTVGVLRQAGDTMTSNSIDLRAVASGGRTVSGAHPLVLTLFFTLASQTS